MAPPGHPPVPATYGNGRTLKSRPQADDSRPAPREHFHPAKTLDLGEPMYVTELRTRLYELHLERIEAEAVGLTECETYMRDLEEEISQCRAAFVGAVVTEMAIERAELTGPLLG
jgi:hypothetical protein